MFSNFECKEYLSSLSCAITIGGLPIGGLQDFSFTENYNTKQINSLGRSFSNTFISGFFSGEIKAKKIFIEEGLMASAIIHNSTASISSSKLDNGDFLLNDESSINYLFKYIAPSTTYDNLIYSLFYDFILYDDKCNVIAKITDCILDQRTTSISISNIIIMEDVVFKFKTIEKVYNEQS